MRRVIVESPYAVGNVLLNARYMRACLHDSLTVHGEAPLSLHGLYTQPGVYDYKITHDRNSYVYAGIAWRQTVEVVIVYTDLGVHWDMQYGIDYAEQHNQLVVRRALGGPWTLLAPYTDVIGTAQFWNKMPRAAYDAWGHTYRWGVHYADEDRIV